MEKEELKKLVAEGLSSDAIAKKFGKCQTTIRYWLGKYGLGTKRIHKCRVCRESDASKFASGRYTECKKCRRKDQNKTNWKRKRILVEYAGGECVQCGYNRCLAAMDFHHLDPSQKDPNWVRMRHWTAERVKKEIDKCQLVCRNCHSEIHYGIDQSVA